MASYQEIEVRLVGVENALKFLMESMRVREMIGSPLAEKPLVRELSMFDYYREQLAKGILEPVTEKKDETNGTAEPAVVGGE